MSWTRPVHELFLLSWTFPGGLRWAMSGLNSGSGVLKTQVWVVDKASFLCGRILYIERHWQFKLQNSLANCHVARGSPCNSWVLVGVPRMTHWKISTKLGRLTVRTRVKSKFGNQQESLLQLHYQESTESWIARGVSFAGRWFCVSRPKNFMNQCLNFTLSLLKQQPIWVMLMRRTLLLSAWLFIASRDNLSALSEGWWKKRAFVTKWYMKRCYSGIHCGQKTSLATVSFSGSFVRKRRSMLWAIPPPSLTWAEMQWAKESVDSKTSPGISEHWKFRGSGRHSSVQWGRSWSSSGASVTGSSVTLGSKPLWGVRERPSAWPIDFPGLCTTS